METFITKIYVKESRGGVRDLEIPLSETQRQHLIITGKNGSGKTGLLEEISKFLAQIENEKYEFFSLYKESLSDELKKLNTFEDVLTDEKITVERNIKKLAKELSEFGEVELFFTNSPLFVDNQYQTRKLLLADFGAKRLVKLNIPTGIKKIDFKEKYQLHESVSANFIQHIVNLKADRSFAKAENDIVSVNEIDEWFYSFENLLKDIFNVSELTLDFDRNTYHFSIIIDGQEPFDFNTLSDGYSAIISIVTELLLRMEAHNAKVYDMEGIVLIDEIETHLHVELQKRVLPFLIAFFPKIQFIVTTHSPFVISSVANATICDLEHKIVTNDLSAYSSETILESYFMTDKYSDEIKRKVAEYEQLLSKKDKTIEDNVKIKELKDYFNHVPKYRTEELLVKLQQIELNNLK